MIENCKTCGIESSELEVHHIIPSSRGGSDNPNNLIKICVNCHMKAHDVSFRGKEGVVSEGQRKWLKKNEDARKWLEKNEGIVDKFYDDLHDNNIEKLHTLNYIMNEQHTHKKSLYLYELINFGESKIRLTFKI